MDIAGREHGQGEEIHEDGRRFEGECVNGKRQGRWLITRPDGAREEGEFVDSRRQGRWAVTHAGGKREEGEIVDNLRQGFWIETRADGGRAEQEWSDNKRVGDAKVGSGGRVRRPPPPPAWLRRASLHRVGVVGGSVHCARSRVRPIRAAPPHCSARPRDVGGGRGVF
jgi:hypothetical protein